MCHWRKKYNELISYRREQDDYGYIAFLEKELDKALPLKLPGYQPNSRTAVVRKPMKNGGEFYA